MCAMNNETDSCIEQPAHYDFGQMEAREIIELAIADFRDPTTIYHVASALKYLLRASRKNGADDIAKARKHVGWAEDAARAYEKRIAQADRDFLAVVSDLEFRHGDIDAVCGMPTVGKAQPGMGIRDAGEFTQPPNCAHPMAAEGLRLADEQPCNPPRHSESAWSVTWPGEVTRPSEAAARARLELIEGAAKAMAEAEGRAYPNWAAAQTAYQTLVGN